MEWAAALEALGGGASAILTLGAIYLFWIERGAKETYLQMLMDRKDEDIRSSQRREIAIQVSLEAVTEIVKEYARSK
jgi:hypothetical protein